MQIILSLHYAFKNQGLQAAPFPYAPACRCHFTFTVMYLHMTLFLSLGKVAIWFSLGCFLGVIHTQGQAQEWCHMTENNVVLRHSWMWNTTSSVFATVLHWCLCGVRLIGFIHTTSIDSFRLACLPSIFQKRFLCSSIMTNSTILRSWQNVVKRQ